MDETEMKVTVPRGRPAITDAKRQRMRNEIAGIAKRLFQDEGYAMISMRRIAGEIGCSPMTLYNYYDAKIDILRTLWSDVFSELFHQLEAVLEMGKAEASISRAGISEAGKNKLQCLGSAYVQYWLDHTEYYRLVFIADGVTQPDVDIFVDSPELVRHISIFAQAISDSFSEGLESDELKPKLDAFLCFLNGIAHNLITVSGYPWSDPDKMVAMAVTAVTE